MPPISLHRLMNGRLLPSATPVIPGWTAGDSLIGFASHPQKPMLALLNVAKPTLSFVRFAEISSGFASMAWGNTVPVERDPYVVRFTPDGRHVLVDGTYAGFRYDLNPNSAPRGSLHSIRVACGRYAYGATQHRFVARAKPEPYPRSWTSARTAGSLSPPTWSGARPSRAARKWRADGSMSLIRLDPDTGVLKRVGDFALDGALPEMTVFDKASRFVAVTVFNQFDAPRQGFHRFLADRDRSVRS